MELFNELAAKDTLKLGELLSAIEIISELDKDMPMAMVKSMLLLMVEDGRGPNEIAREMGTVPAVASRHISDLGEMRRRNPVGAREEGHQIVEQRIDPIDRRHRRAWLTPKGREVRARILQALNA
jgi:DNA-binding MarR family transcriptional regulator